MFHSGTRTVGGNFSGDLGQQVNGLLTEFVEIVHEIMEMAKIRRAVVRSQLQCNLLIVRDADNVFVAAEKASGMPSTVQVDQGQKRFSLQDVLDAAKWEFGFDNPFAIQFPVSSVDLDKEKRRPVLWAIAQQHVQSEVNRVEREMNIIQVNPIFGPAAFTVDQRLTFVLMPFDDDLTEIYRTIIKPCVESDTFNLVCKRADDIKTNKAIIQDIFKAICEARIIIADVTRLNPNVMYELGIAHTLGKETVLIYQKEQELKFPFDLAHIRRIEYENSATGGKLLEQELRGVLKTIVTPIVQ